jgi:hypothetical protein
VFRVRDLSIKKAKILKRIIVTAMVLVLFALAVFVKLDFIKDAGGGGYLLWKNDQAFLFMGDSPIGYRMSVARCLVEPILELFYAVALPADKASIVTIIRITPSGVERSESTASQVGFYDITAVGNEIYAQCAGGICALSGMKFQLLAEQDEQKIESSLSREDFEGSNGGWSRRSIWPAHVGEKTTPYEFSIGFSNGDRLVVRGGNPVSVDLLRQNHAPERVWYHEQRTRIVSTAAYEQAFRPH